MKIVVAGALANNPGNAGGVWERLSWASGFRKLGHETYFIEQITEPSETARTWFRNNVKQFGLGDHSALIGANGEVFLGPAWSEIRNAIASSILVNLSGHLTIPSLVEAAAKTIYIDVDPGYTQIWHDDPALPFRVPRHDFYYTLAENIWSVNCTIPRNNLPWRPIRQPVVLDDWPMIESANVKRFTTIASWRGAFGPVAGYGVKAHEFRKMIALPQQCDAEFELALDIHAGDAKDRQSLEAHGWRIAEPPATAQSFREYIQHSSAEFSVAQGVYVGTRSGWFSDRTTRYLASGKPALVQETWSPVLSGEGLVTFHTLEYAIEAVAAIQRAYPQHCRAARALAEKYFDSDVVLQKLLAEIMQ